MIIPVIHVLTETQALENIEIIKKCGLNKAFLISHGNISWKQLLKIAKEIKEKHNMWIGCNFLDIDSELVFDTLKENINQIDGLWIDDSFSETDKIKHIYLKNAWKNSGFKGLYFGGVSFKGCVQPNSLEKATETAIDAMDVITTSGPATGIPPSFNKLGTMKDIAQKKPLGLASGVDETNIRQFSHYVDYFIVASSIEEKFGRISEEKLRRLLEKAK